jgi:hypothetical protein
MRKKTGGQAFKQAYDGRQLRLSGQEFPWIMDVV